MWSFPITRRSAMIIAAGILMNSLLFLVANRLELPLWLDCTGTAYSALMLGPLAGLLVGLVNNVILASVYFGWNTYAYYLISAAIALLVGVTARRGAIRGLLSVVGLATLGYLASVFLGWVVTMVLFGAPNDPWGVTIFDALERTGLGTSLSTLAANALVRAPDITVTTLLVALAVNLTPGGPPRPSSPDKAKKKGKKKRKKSDRDAAKPRRNNQKKTEVKQ